jgi:hypothetical protein
MSLKSPIVKFFGTQRNGYVSPGRVPFKEPDKKMHLKIQVSVLDFFVTVVVNFISGRETKSAQIYS